MIKPTLNYGDLNQADIVVEAVFENMELKKKVFGEIDKVAKPGAVLPVEHVDVLSSTRSSCPMTMAGYTCPTVITFQPGQRDEVVGNRPLKQSKQEVLATSMALAKRLGKVGVLVGNCWGFVGNRMFGP